MSWLGQWPSDIFVHGTLSNFGIWGSALEISDMGNTYEQV